VGDIEVDGFDVGTPEEEKKPVPLQIEVVSERERAWLLFCATVMMR